MDGLVTVGEMQPAEAAEAAAIHQEVLGAEFITRAGHRFLRRYYLAWVRSEGGVALAARADGTLVGALLGSVRPARHYRSMLRQDGWRLAALMLGRGVTHPAFGAELLISRGPRYSRALIRVGRAQLSARRAGGIEAVPIPASNPGRVGEVTHILVDPDHQGRGVARALLGAAEDRARQAGLDRLVLVTTAELARSGLYDRLGWVPKGDLTSRSGEEFWRYERTLGSDET
ncbi:MAG: GNAT family N-acetyltransferase [Acidimicrobiales bacterium]